MSDLAGLIIRCLMIGCGATLVGALIGGIVGGVLQRALSIPEPVIGYACRLAGVSLAIILVSPIVISLLIDLCRI